MGIGVAGSRYGNLASARWRGRRSGDWRVVHGFDSIENLRRLAVIGAIGTGNRRRWLRSALVALVVAAVVLAILVIEIVPG